MVEILHSALSLLKQVWSGLDPRTQDRWHNKYGPIVALVASLILLFNGFGLALPAIVMDLKYVVITIAAGYIGSQVERPDGVLSPL